MNIETVKSLFSLFSGEEDCRKFMPVIELAIAETEKMLVSDEAALDLRADYLCAAFANYRYCQINSAKDRTMSAAAGMLLTTPENSGTLKYAGKLLSDYIDLCSDIVKSGTFMFMSFGSNPEREDNDDKENNC